jgi:hypothetical protein
MRNGKESIIWVQVYCPVEGIRWMAFRVLSNLQSLAVVVCFQTLSLINIKSMCRCDKFSQYFAIFNDTQLYCANTNSAVHPIPSIQYPVDIKVIKIAFLCHEFNIFWSHAWTWIQYRLESKMNEILAFTPNIL